MLWYVARSIIDDANIAKKSGRERRWRAVFDELASVSDELRAVENNCRKKLLRFGFF